MGKHARPVSAVHDISKNRDMLKIVGILSEAAAAMRKVSETSDNPHVAAFVDSVDLLLSTSVRVLR